MKKWILRWAIKKILNSLEDPKFKEYMVKCINSNIDVPNLNEKEEAAVIKEAIDGLYYWVKTRY